MPKQRRVLISTIAPVDGGVPAMVRFAAETLRTRQLEPVIAFYQPRSIDPDISVPVHKILTHRVRSKRATVFNGIESHAMGAMLPELEYFHFYPTGLWRDLIDSTDFHIAVSGNCLAAAPFVLTGRPFWGWVATPWEDDRTERARRFSPLRRAWDQTANAPLARRLEKKIIRTGAITGLSKYTQTRLNRVVGKECVRNRLPMGVDTDRFRPSTSRQDQKTLTIGFTGRLNDPRKNISLLIRTVELLQRQGIDVCVLLAGGSLNSEILDLIRRTRVGERVEVVGRIESRDLPDLYRRMNVFVIPSIQEGLCISALEAMSCGVPVVSTRCGGPEEFVREGVTGSIAAADPEALGQAILAICDNPDLRRELGTGARALVESEYKLERTRDAFCKVIETSGIVV